MQLTPQQWERVQELYLAASDLPPVQRRTLLADADSDLRREVEALLAASEESAGFLDGSVMRAELQQWAEDHSQSLVGERLAHYEIVSVIGSGGMGDVYLARDTRLDRTVALKVLPSYLTLERDRLARFEREARTASSLNHPNIITIYDFGRSGDTYFLTTEYVAGETLRQKMAGGAMPVPQALDIILQTAAALEAAHAAGVVHRDIKPDNVMVRPDGLVKVLDFGLARFVEQRPKPSQANISEVRTYAGTVVGTPRYMSPEQARGRPVDIRTDIFSLGVVLYELLTGVSPFRGANTAEVFAALLEREPPPVSPHAGNHVGQIIRKAIRKEPDERFQTMAQFSAELRRVKPGTRPRYGLAVAGIAVAALVGVAAWRLAPGKSSSPAAVQQVLPVTSFPGFKEDPAFSPDGGSLAFTWDGGVAGPKPATHIFAKTIGGGDPLQLTFGARADHYPLWSPDGKQIAFLRSLERAVGVFVVPALGGNEKKVADGGWGLSWSPDGKTLALASVPEKDYSSYLVLHSLATGERRDLTHPKPYSDSFPAFSPDGKYIAFLRSFSASAREVMLMPVEGGEPARLTFDKRPTWGLTWTPDSKEIIYSANRGGGEQLWGLNISGGTPRVVATGALTAFHPAVSQKGHRLAFTQAFSDTNIVAYEGPNFASASPQPVVSSTREDHSPDFSPDGKQIVFVSKRTGNEEVWICDRGGGRQRQLTTFGGPPVGSPRWSPDGRLIVFDSRAAGSADIWLVAVEGGTPRQLTTETSEDMLPSWSRDSRWIYFASNRGGTRRIWKMPIEAGAPIPVSGEGGHQSSESADGKTLYYNLYSLAPGIRAVSVDGTNDRALPELSRAGDRRSWAVVPNGLYFATSYLEGKQALMFYDSVTRRLTRILTLEQPPLLQQSGLAVAPDGKTLLYAQLVHAIQEILVVENFQ